MHAFLHRLRYQEIGDERDKLAADGLEGLVSKQEIVHNLQKLGGLKAKQNPSCCVSKAYKLANAEAIRQRALNTQPLAVQSALKPEAMVKRKATYVEIKHQQGPNNSQYGTKWITDGINSKKIKADEPLPIGWAYGRKMPKRGDEVRNSISKR